MGSRGIYPRRGHSAAPPRICRPGGKTSGAALRCAPGVRGLLCLLALFAFIATRSFGQESPAERHPVPKSGPQARELKAIKEQFRAEYAKHDPQAELALCNE